LQPDHELKSWPLFFQAFVDGLKKHDLRDIRDRTFEPGEIVRLLEWDPDGSGYTGRELWMVVTYVTDRNHPCALSSMALDKGTAIISLDFLT
jgi:hypothetical protein